LPTAPIANLDEILDGRYRSTTGMGIGLIGAHRLMDRCEVASSPAGTIVLMRKLFDPRAEPVAAAGIERIRAALRVERGTTLVDELQQQQQELLLALADARDRQEQLARLNRELEHTNRGVVALYAELDEQADHLRRADEMKSRFLSNMSHEFRTPLNSIRALSGLLLERVDGPLADEQERQVELIRKATDELSNLVEDLLDLARIEAGRLEIHAAEFAIDDLFSALRGMLRPLLVGDAVALRYLQPTAHSAPTKEGIADPLTRLAPKLRGRQRDGRTRDGADINVLRRRHGHRRGARRPGTDLRGFVQVRASAGA
jgi:signal transduction histidine kinase